MEAVSVWSISGSAMLMSWQPCKRIICRCACGVAVVETSHQSSVKLACMALVMIGFSGEPQERLHGSVPWTVSVTRRRVKRS